MIFSAEDLFSEDQALTASAASTNYYDNGAHGTVLGAPSALDYANEATMIPIEVVSTLAAGGTSPTLTVKVQSDDNTSFSSATDVTPEYSIGTAAGSRLSLQVLPENINERYFRLYYTLGGTSPTFTVTAGVVGARQANYLS